MIGTWVAIGRARLGAGIVLGTDVHHNMLTDKYKVTHILYGPGQDSAKPYYNGYWEKGSLAEAKKDGAAAHKAESARLRKGLKGK